MLCDSWRDPERLDVWGMPPTPSPAWPLLSNTELVHTPMVHSMEVISLC
jgi:hypothetical protein